jgi:GNAT superfamily N-acetyltransferase
VTLVPEGTPGATRVAVTALELRDPAGIRPARVPGVDPVLWRAEEPAPELSRFFYTAVGGDWYWVDRLGWDLAAWTSWVDRPELELWHLWVSGSPAGYVELERQPGGEVEIAYFGLLGRAAGRGLGGWLLERALRRAFEPGGTSRVWVHTCDLDGPHALANYEARGMVRCGGWTEWRDLTHPTPGPWPGARG